MNHEMDETCKKMTPVRSQADREGGGKIGGRKIQTNFAGKLSVLASLVLTLAGRGAEAADDSYAAQVAAKPVFPSPLEWSGEQAPPEAESQALLEAIGAFESSGIKAGFTALEGFLGAHPGSAWGPSLQVNMAEYYRNSGRYTLALAHWEEAWTATKTNKQPGAQRTAARAVAGWTRLLASLGQKDKLNALFKEVDELQLPLGTYGTTVEGTKDGLIMMNSKPGVSYRCGSFALGQVARALHPDAQLKALFDAESPDGGFRLSELLDLAQSNGIPVVAVRRPAGGEIVVPSVIHWKLNHYAAIVEQKGDYYKVMDPTFGGHAWIDADTIDAEASGVFLVPTDQAPTRWAKLSAAECVAIYGKGFPDNINDPEDPGPDDCDPSDGDEGSDCDPPSSGDGPGGDGDPDDPPPCGCGMPVWKVSEPYGTVWLQDIPLIYRLSNGKWMKLELRYKHRGEYRGANLPGFGDKWECNWLGTLMKGSSITDTYTNHMIRGGLAPFNTNGVLEYLTARWLTFEPGLTPAILTPFGARNAYRASLTVYSGLTAYPLTHKIDRYGRTILFNHVPLGNALVLNNVVDIDGRTCTLTYTSSGPVSNLIASVTDPSTTRTAHFYYDSSGRLTNIVDMIGMSTTFQYDSTNRITSMTTPYGTTGFQYLSGISTNYSNSLRRSVLVTEPSGDHQLYSYCDYGPNGVASGDFAYYRNSYHWNRAQYAAIPPADRANVLDMPDADYLRGATKHWLHGLNDSGGNMTVTCTLNAQAGTMAADSSRPATTFSYYGQISGNQIGALRRIAAYSTPIYQGLSVQRNSLGRPTNITYQNTDPIAGTTFPTYTNLYDSSGTRLLTQTGPHNELVRRYGYHPVLTNLLIAVTNALGEVIRYTHDTNLIKVTSITFPSGLVRSNIYYSSGPSQGFLQRQMDIGFRTNSFGYLNGNLAAQTNELGLVTTYIWDNLNRLISTAFPDGTTSSNVYNKLDLVAVKDRLNQWTYYGYDSLRQRIAETNVNGQVTQYTYCGCGSPSQVTRWNNGVAVTTQFFYDADGRLTNTIYADGYQINYGFNNYALMDTVSDSSGRQVNLNYAQIGRQFKLSSAYVGSDLFFQQQFDDYGRVTNSIDRNGVTVASGYDILNRLTNRLVVSYLSVPPGPEKFVYNPSGLTNYFDSLGNLTIFVRDGLGRVLYETNANQELLQFSYNPSSELTSLVDGKNQTTTWKYDIFGRVTNKVDALGTNAFVYQYDPNARLTNRTSAAKGATRYVYDPVGNLTNVVYPVSTNLVFQYDGLNRLTNMMDAIGATAFTWTPGDQLAGETGPWANDAIGYTYNNRLRGSVSLAQPSASPWVQSYGYDQAWRLASVSSPAGAFGYNYTSGSSELVNYMTYPNGASSGRGFDDVARLSTVYLLSAQNAVLDQYTYYYDPGSQRTQQVFTAGNYVNYTYDKIGQVKTARGYESDGATLRLHEQFGYAYDKGWNLNYRTNNALTETFAANAVNELTSISRTGTLTVAGTAGEPSASVTVSGTGLSSGAATVYGDGTWARTNAAPASGQNTYTAIGTDAVGSGRTSQDSVTVTLLGTNSYSYDANGNLLSDGQRTFAYDDENQLSSATVSNAWRSEFTYDGLRRRRIRKEYTWSGSAWLKTNEVRYVYDRRLIVQERDANNLPLVGYTRGNDLSGHLQGAGGIGGLLARTDPSLLALGSSLAHAYYHCDGNGNVTCLINASNAVVARYSYDPFGSVLSMSGPLAGANLYRFSSKEIHPNSGLVYYLYRYHDPNLQRWINRDPLGLRGGTNTYSYVFNNPNALFDANGLCGNDDNNANSDGYGGMVDEYLDAAANRALNDEIVDYAMGEGYSDSSRQRLQDTLDMIPNEGFVFAGGEEDLGQHAHVEGLGFFGGSGPYFEPFYGVEGSGGFGPVSGGAAWTSGGGGFQPVGLFEPQVKGFDYGGGAYCSPNSHGLFAYVGIGRNGFLGFGIGWSR